MVAIIIPFIVYAIPSSWMHKFPDDWYWSLKRAPWTPPAGSFGVAWFTIWICEGIASYLVYQTGGDVRHQLRLYLITISLTAMWPTVFFKWHLITWATIHIIVNLILATILTIAFARVKKTAGLLLMPFLIWSSLATSLQIYIFLHN